METAYNLSLLLIKGTFTRVLSLVKYSQQTIKNGIKHPRHLKDKRQRKVIDI